MIANIKKDSFGEDLEQAENVSEVAIADYLIELIYHPESVDDRLYWFKVIAAKWVLDKLGDKK